MESTFVLVVMLAAAFAMPRADAAETRWRLATGYRGDSFHTRNIEVFSQEVDSATAGALKIDVHSAGDLIKLADIRAAVEAGTVEAGESIMTRHRTQTDGREVRA